MVWHLKNFTDKNKTVKWCPQRGCEYMVKKKISSDEQIILCKCKKEFCFRCSHDENHLPSSCNQVAKWVEKESSDSGDLQWIKANCKICPGCKNPINKN